MRKDETMRHRSSGWSRRPGSCQKGLLQAVVRYFQQIPASIDAIFAGATLVQNWVGIVSTGVGIVNQMFRKFQYGWSGSRDAAEETNEKMNATFVKDALEQSRWIVLTPRRSERSLLYISLHQLADKYGCTQRGERMFCRMRTLAFYSFLFVDL
jgi:hypothetical protein